MPVPVTLGAQVSVMIPVRIVESLLYALAMPSEEDESQWLDPIFLLKRLPEDRVVSGIARSLTSITAAARGHFDMKRTLSRVTETFVMDSHIDLFTKRRRPIRFGASAASSLCDSCFQPTECEDVVRFRCAHQFHQTCFVSNMSSELSREDVAPHDFFRNPRAFAVESKRNAIVFPACPLDEEPVLGKAK
jgi:hypothetical protein